MKRKHLEEALEEVEVFDEPKIELEQIPTSPHIAASMIFTAVSNYADIEGQMVGDFGCGPGILSLACCMMGATAVIGVDVDEEALDIAWVNKKKMDIENIDLVMADVQSLDLNVKLDTVVMNPLLGLGMRSTAFVMKALEYADVVYLAQVFDEGSLERLVKAEDLKFEVMAELKSFKDL